MPDSLRILLQLMLSQSRNILNIHSMSKVLMVCLGMTLAVSLLQLNPPSLINSVLMLASAIIARFTKPVMSIFGGPSFDHPSNWRSVQIKPIEHWSEAIGKAISAVHIAKLNQEINGQEYADINEYLKDEAYAEARDHLRVALTEKGKVTYKDVLSLIVYAEGKNAWMERELSLQVGRRARDEILLDGVGGAEFISEANSHQDDYSRKMWRKITVEKKR